MVSGRTGQNRIDPLQRQFRCLARRHGFRLICQIAFQRLDDAVESGGQVAGNPPFEFTALLGIQSVKAGFPFLAGRARVKAGNAPGVESIGRDVERFVRPAQRFSRADDLFLSQRSAMG